MSILYDGLIKLGVEDAKPKAERLERYVDEIMLFNPTLKLVGDKDRDKIIIRHVLDSAAAYRAFLDYTRVGDEIADLGSGAGFPAVVLSILLPDRDFVLVERMERRVGFLRGVVARLRLENVRIVSEDIKDIREDYSALTCRAFHPLVDIAAPALRLLKEGGVALMYKGQRSSVDKELAELSGAGYDFGVSHIPLSVPFLEREAREICVLTAWRKR